MTPDLIVRGGTVIDGTGSPARKSDVAIAGDRIVHVGPITAVEGIEELEADDLTVAPGFIDPHSHSDFTLLVDPRAVSSISQGVTAEVVGNCGYGCGPIANADMAHEVIYGFRPELPITWRSVAGYLERLEQARPAVNVLTLVPNGQLRLGTVGAAPRPATSEELARMQDLLRKGLEEGAFGYSTGLEYATETGATEEEVTALCRVVADAGGIYATHTRNRDEAAVEAVAEAIRTADNAGVALQVSHITPRGGREDTERSIELVETARARGGDVAFDMHTRFFGTTYLKVLLPAWALEGSPDDIARRLADPESRERMKSHRNLIAALGDWSRVVLLDNPAFPQLSRRKLRRHRGGDGPRSPRRRLRHPPGRGQSAPPSLRDPPQLHGGTSQADLRASPVPGRFRRHRPGARWSARRLELSWSLYVGLLVLPPHGPGNRNLHSRGGHTQAERPGGRTIRPRRSRHDTYRRLRRLGHLRPENLRRDRDHLRAQAALLRE